MNDWDDVRFFLEVARHGNVSGAARVLGVNHSTVSRRIKALEEKQGVTLFERLPTGYQLTDEALELYDLALDIEARNQTFARKLQGQDARLEGRVTVTMPHDIFEFFLCDQLARFRQEYPGIDLNVAVAQGLKNLSAREADIAVRLTDAPPQTLVGKRIVGLGYGLYKAPELPEQDTTPIIAWRSEDTPPDWASKHLHNPKIALRVDDLFAMYRAVAAGFGIARMPLYMHNLAQHPEVARLDINLPESQWGLWLLSHADLRKTARVQACRNFLNGCLTQHQSLFNKPR